MLKNYMVTAIRNIRRNAVISIISIFGLSIGMASSFLAFLFIQYETTFDTFHKNAPVICRVMKQGINAKNEVIHWTNCGADIGPLLMEKYPEIVNIVRFTHQDGTLSSDKNTYFEESQVFFVDPSVFTIFSFSLRQGDKEHILSEPDAAVITPHMAQKYFGDDNPVGKKVSFQNAAMKRPLELEIKGVVNPVPDNSHIQFGLLVSFTTLKSVYLTGYLDDDLRASTHTYCELSSASVFNTLQKKITSGYFPQFQTDRNLKSVLLERLKDIYLSSPAFPGIGEKRGNKNYLILLCLSVIFILFISCLNVVNLLTARASGRGKEVGIRKISGATRSELITQFLIESIVLSLLSLVGALILVEISLPLFNTLIQRNLIIDYSRNIGFLSVLIFLTIFTGIISGIYPSLFLSSFKPVVMLRGRRGRFTKTIRKIIVVTQFVISISLFISSVIVSGESEFLKSRDPGFEQEKIITVNLSVPGSKGKYRLFKNRLLKQNTIESVTASSFIPWDYGQIRKVDIGSADFKGFTSAYMMLIDPDFLKTYSLSYIEINDFPINDTPIITNTFIINETARETFGWDKAVNKRLGIRNFAESISVEYGIIKGVVKDFHYFHPVYKIEPLILVFAEKKGMMEWNYVSIRIKADRKEQAILTVKQIWADLLPDSPLDYFLLSTLLEKKHSSLTNVIDTALKISTAFAIFIACLGLLGLTFYETEQRTHEIGIRKALGAGTFDITLTLIKSLVVLILYANIIAWPLSIILVKGLFMLFHYPFPLRFKPEIFFLSGLGSFFLTLVTVSGLILRASRANPTEALRYE